MDRERLKTTFRRLLRSGLPVTVAACGRSGIAGPLAAQKLETVFSRYGVADSYALSVLVCRDDLPALPKAPETVTVDGVEYRVLGTVQHDTISVLIDLQRK